MADLSAAKGKLRRVALNDITPHPSDRPRNPGAHTWADAQELPPAEILVPFDVSDIASTLTIDDGCALFLEAPAVREVFSDETVHTKYAGIFGERRLWAALLAGCTHASVKVYDVGPEEAALMHYRENACRVDLPPLADALELARLRDAHGMTEPAIAAKTGRTVDHVRGRLLLLRAIEPVQALLAEGKATIEVVSLFARHAEGDQLRVWEKLSRLPRAETLQAHHVRGMFGDLHLRLSEAPWPLEANVGPRPCVGCPTRSDAQALLFEDAGEAECLDSDCATAKRKAWSEQVRQRAVERGARVLTREESAKILPSWSRTPVDTHVDLDAPSPITDGTGKALTWRLVLPASIVATVAEDGAGNAREVLTVEEAVREATSKILATIESVGDKTEKVAALDGWAAAIAASRPEIREPDVKPLPKAKAKGSAGERSKAEAKADVEEQIAILRKVHSHAWRDVDADRLAAWALRAVSSDAICLVAEMLDADNPSAPAEVVRGALEAIEEDMDALDILAALLAAELLVRGGDGAELPARWAGVAPDRREEPATKATGGGDAATKPRRARRKGKATPAPAATAESSPEASEGPSSAPGWQQAASAAELAEAAEPTDAERLDAHVVALCVERPRPIKGLMSRCEGREGHEVEASVERLLAAGRLREMAGGKLAAVRG